MELIEACLLLSRRKQQKHTVSRNIDSLEDNLCSLTSFGREKKKKGKPFYNLSAGNNLLRICRPLPCSNQHKATLETSLQKPQVIRFSVLLWELGQDLQRSREQQKAEQTSCDRAGSAATPSPHPLSKPKISSCGRQPHY